MKILHIRSLAVSLAVLMLAAALIISSACKNKGSGHSEAKATPPTVVVAAVNQKTVPIYSEYVGQTRADNTVELRARVEGVLQKVYFREGTPVKRVNSSSPSTSDRLTRRCNQPKQLRPRQFPIWPKRNSALTSFKRRHNWPKPTLC